MAMSGKKIRYSISSSCVARNLFELHSCYRWSDECFPQDELSHQLSRILIWLCCSCTGVNQLINVVEMTNV